MGSFRKWGILLAALAVLAGCGGAIGEEGVPGQTATPSAPAAGEEAGPGEEAGGEGALGQTATLTFPADEWGTPAFTLTLPLPAGWEARPLPQQGDTTPRFWAADTGYAFYEGERQVGGVGYGTYAWYPNTDNYRSVYSPLMLGSLASWDVDYTPVQDGGTAFGVATCRPVYKQVEDYPELSAAEVPEEHCLGILAHDARLLAYVNLWFAPDALGRAELTAMAQALALAPAEELPAESVEPDGAPAALKAALAGMGRLPQGAGWDTEQSRVEWVDGQRAYLSTLLLGQGEQAVSCGEYALGLGDGQVFRRQAGAWQPISGPIAPGEALDQLVAGLTYEGEGVFSVQIPWEWPDPAGWGLLVYGRLEAQGLGGMSFHALEAENQARSWQPGAAYQFQAPQGMTELWLDATLEGDSRTVDLLALAE